MHKAVSVLGVSAVAALLASCASLSGGSARFGAAPLVDDFFPGYEEVEIPVAEDIFKLDQPMRDLVAEKVNIQGRMEDRLKALVNGVITDRGLKMAPELVASTNAVDTFYGDVANCLSASILGYALAREAKLNVQFQKVNYPDYWTPLGQYSAMPSHVTLLFRIPQKTGHNSAEAMYSGAWDSYSLDYELDFSPDLSESRFRRTPLAEEQAIALFYTNLAVAKLVDEDYPGTYRLLREALKFDARNADIWVNLGVLYRSSGHRETALEAYRYAMSLDRDNTSATNNYVHLMERMGRASEVVALKRWLEDKRETNPYYHAHLAADALSRGDYDSARRLYLKAIGIDRRIHEFYAGLATTYYALGDIERSRRYLQQAFERAEFEDDQYRYSQQLEFLNASSG